MSRRDEHRLDVGAGTQHRADGVLAMLEWRPVALLVSRFGVAATQSRLGDTEGRQVEPQPQVAGHAQPARVSDALAIHHYQFRLRRQPCEGGQGRRYLAKRQQAGNIGHARRLTVYHLLHYLEFAGGNRRPGQHDHRRPRDLTALLEADVHAGDPAHRTQTILELHPAGQPLLQLDGRLWREVPVMQGRGGHSSFLIHGRHSG